MPPPPLQYSFPPLPDENKSQNVAAPAASSASPASPASPSSTKRQKTSWQSTYNRLLGGIDIVVPGPAKTSNVLSSDDREDNSFVAWEALSSSPTSNDTTAVAGRSVSSPNYLTKRGELRKGKLPPTPSRKFADNAPPTPSHNNSDPAKELMDKFKNSPSPIPTYPFPALANVEAKKRVLRKIESDIFPMASRRSKTLSTRPPQDVQQLYSPGYLKRSLSFKPSHQVQSAEPKREKEIVHLISLADRLSRETSFEGDLTPAKDTLPSKSNSHELDLSRFLSSESDIDLAELDRLEMESKEKPAINEDDFEDSSQFDDDIDFEELERLEKAAKELPQQRPHLVLDSDSDDDLDEIEQLLTKVSTKNDFKSEKLVRKRLSEESEGKQSLDICVLKPTLHRYLVKTISYDGIEESIKYDDRFVILTALTTVDSQQILVEITLKGSWVDTPIEVNDIFHIIGNYTPSSTKVTVDSLNNLLILLPDILVTCTNVADSLSCKRRVILRDRIRATADSSRFFIIGSLVHELFQICLEASDFSTDYINEQINYLVFGVYLEELTLVDMTADEAIEELNMVVPNFKEWYRIYCRASPSDEGKVDDHRSNNSLKSTLISISKVIDIEEEIWSPMFGLKGKIDATVEARIKQGINSGTYLVPLELKSSKSSKSISHRAQTTLYTLLLSDRYNLDISCGVLYYSSMNEMIRIPALWDEIRNLINVRNELVRYLGKTQDLPEVIGDVVQCRNCGKSDVCMVYHKSEGGTEETSRVSFFNSFTEHLTEKHIKFFTKWDDLLFKEQSDINRYLKEIWTMGSESREKAGRCYGKMIISELVEETKTSQGTKYTYTLQRYGGGADLSINNELINGEPIIVSDESGHVCLARGNLRYATNNQVRITVNRRLATSMKKLPGFDSENNQLFHSMLAGSKNETNESESPQIFRIDKDEFTLGMTMLRNNLLQLFVKNGDERRRRLIVDLEAPRFETQTTINSEPPPNLNPDQIKAIDKVLQAKDYALILGMPGTGKTTTIAAIVEKLVSQNKTVLIASHTHSAVDNILLKLRNRGFDMLRLGGVSKVHPDIVPYVATHSNRATNRQEIEERYFKPPVVGTTCFGVNNWLCSKRKFDYCIVDEASQTTLPSCLGPIRLADKFVLVGDHYQLSPLVRNADALEGGLDVSLFKYLCESHPQAMVNLEHQYRMCSDIMVLSNKLIYDGRLKCGSDDVAKQKLKIPNRQGITWTGGWLDKVLDEQ